MSARAGSRLTASPPPATLRGITVALSVPLETYPIPVTLPEISSALLDSATDDEIAVFAFCVVEKPMLRTTKAKAAATITNAIITIADSIPMTPLRVFLLLVVEFISCSMMCLLHIPQCATTEQTLYWTKQA